MFDKLKKMLGIKPKVVATRGRIHPPRPGDTGPVRKVQATMKPVVKINRIYSKKLNRWLTPEEYHTLTGSNNG